MSQRVAMLALIGLLVVGGAFSAAAQDAAIAGPIPDPVRILVLDETKTFLSTMRVAGVVGGLRQLPFVEVDVRLADVESSWDDPLAGEALPEDTAPYEIIVIVPRGIDNASIGFVWIVTAGLREVAPAVAQAVEIVSQIVDGAFAGIATGVDVSEDLYPGLLWALYVNEGWFR